MTFSVVIPAWRGIEQLKKNLPAVLKMGADEVIVGDDASPENDAEFVKQHFPSVKVYRNKTNLGFGSNVNKGFQQARGEVVVLLNQDVKPQPDILKFLKEDFRDPQVFGVSLAEQHFGPTKGAFQDGFIVHQPIKPRPQKVTLSFWVSGGTGSFRKKYWDQLGGFDPIYDPGYWEDLDIGYRAQKRGWKVLWDPRAKVYHEREQSFGGEHFDQTYKSRLQERNHLLFNWKNLQDRGLLISHCRGLLKRVINHPGYLRIVILALMRLPMLISSRQKLGHSPIADRGLVNLN